MHCPADDNPSVCPARELPESCPPAPGLQEGRARLGAAIPRVPSAAGGASAPWVTRSSGKPMTSPGRASWSATAIPALMALTKTLDKQ